MTNGISTEGFPKESHAHQLQAEYLEFIDALLETIHKALQAAGEWNLGGKERDVRFFVDNQEKSKEALAPSDVEKIRQAVESPEKLQGTVCIKVDDETVFRVTDGKVTHDSLGLSKVPQQEIKANQAAEQAKIAQSETSTETQQTASPQLTTSQQTKNRKGASKNVQELKAEVQQLKEELDQKTQEINQQSQRISALETTLDTLTDKVKNVEDKSFSLWLNKTVSTVVQGFKQFVDIWTKSNVEFTQQLQQRTQPVLQAIAQETGTQQTKSPSLQEIAASENANPVTQPLTQGIAAQQTNHFSLQEFATLQDVIKDIKVRFDDSIKVIEEKLVTLENQIQNIQLPSVEQNNTKITTEQTLKPASAASSEKIGITQSIGTIKSKSEQSPQPSQNSQTASKNFNAEQVVAAAEKILEGIPAINPDGLRSFQTGNGYSFEKVGNTLTVKSPDRSDLVRAIGQGKDRQISFSSQLSSQNVAQLENIGQKLDSAFSQKLAEKQVTNLSQNQNQSQGRARKI